MKIGDLIETNMWFAYRRRWNENRIGLVLDKNFRKGNSDFVKIMWLDNHRILWESRAQMNQGSRWTKVIK